MAEPAREYPFWAVVLYVALMVLAIMMHLLPLQTTPDHLPMPDLMLVLTCLYAARKPKYVPLLVIAGVFLLADMLMQQPPGLRSLLVVIGTEFLRRQSKLLRAGTLMMEWATVAAVIAAIILAERLVLAIMLLPLPPLLPVSIAGVLSMIVYPIVAALAAATLGLTRRAPGALDYRGQKI